MTTERRSLMRAGEVINATGLKITYPYNDLIFVEHNAFLLRFNDDNPLHYYIHFNEDIFEEKKKVFTEKMLKKGKSLGYIVEITDDYRIFQEEGEEEIRIEFIKQ